MLPQHNRRLEGISSMKHGSSHLLRQRGRGKQPSFGVLMALGDTVGVIAGTGKPRSPQSSSNGQFPIMWSGSYITSSLASASQAWPPCPVAQSSDDPLKARTPMAWRTCIPRGVCTPRREEGKSWCDQDRGQQRHDPPQGFFGPPASAISPAVSGGLSGTHAA